MSKSHYWIHFFVAMVYGNWLFIVELYGTKLFCRSRHGESVGGRQVGECGAIRAVRK